MRNQDLFWNYGNLTFNSKGMDQYINRNNFRDSEYKQQQQKQTYM